MEEGTDLIASLAGYLGMKEKPFTQYKKMLLNPMVESS